MIVALFALLMAAGPSFDCARATSSVNRMICASPDLSALDRKLSDDFQAVSHQGGADAASLQADEEHWLKTVRNHCTTVACIAAAYRARDAALLDDSRKRASPAAYADLQPFPASANALATAKAMVGKRCAGAPAAPLPGTHRIKRFMPVISRNALVSPLAIGGERFAFLLTYSDGKIDQCVVSDVVALPPRQSGDSFLQCSLSLDESYGFAVRQAGGKTAGYWSIDPGARAFHRVAIHVVGEHALKCQQPEGGE